MSTDPNDSFYDDAEKAVAPSRVYFGLMELDTFLCKLVKGSGKVLFDPSTDKGPAMHALKFSLIPLASSTFHEPTVRECIAESVEFTSIIRPSFQKIGLALRGIHGRYVQVEMVPTRKYKNAEGEDKQATTFKFVAVFADESACEAAADSFFGQSRSTDSTTMESAGDTSSGGNGHVAAEPIGTNDPRRVTAAKFLAAMLKGQTDLTKISDILSKPIAGVQFGLADPEVLAVPEVAAMIRG